MVELLGTPSKKAAKGFPMVDPMTEFVKLYLPSHNESNTEVYKAVK